MRATHRFFDLKKLFSFQLPVSAPVMASQDDRRRTDNPDNPNPANPGSDPASAASGIKLLIDINSLESVGADRASMVGVSSATGSG